MDIFTSSENHEHENFSDFGKWQLKLLVQREADSSYRDLGLFNSLILKFKAKADLQTPIVFCHIFQLSYRAPIKPIVHELFDCCLCALFQLRVVALVFLYASCSYVMFVQFNLNVPALRAL